MTKKMLVALALTAALIPARFAAAQLFPAPEPLPNGYYTLQQVSNSRFLDAHTSSNDYAAVTRGNQANDTQRWWFTHLGNHVYLIQQKSNGRFLDAYSDSGNDYGAVTRQFQSNTTQQWKLTWVYAGPNMPSFYSIQQVSTGRYLDAHDDASEDYRVVTRADQNNLTQRWWIRIPVQ